MNEAVYFFELKCITLLAFYRSRDLKGIISRVDCSYFSKRGVEIPIKRCPVMAILNHLEQTCLKTQVLYFVSVPACFNKHCSFLLPLRIFTLLRTRRAQMKSNTTFGLFKEI